jgi:DNA polymerase III delta subunit
MILKSFELNKLNLTNHNFYLFYGDNEGLKDEIIKNLQNTTDVLNAKLSSFDQTKTEKIQIAERLKLIEVERNNLKVYGTFA